MLSLVSRHLRSLRFCCSWWVDRQLAEKLCALADQSEHGSEFLSVSHVIFRRCSQACHGLGSKLSYNLCRGAYDERSVWELLALGDQGICSDNAVPADLGSIQDRCPIPISEPSPMVQP